MPTNRDDYPHIQFAAPQIGDKISERNQPEEGSENITARRDLRRYYKLIQEALPIYSKEQASLLCDLLNGVRIEPIERAPQLIRIEVHDAPDAIFEKWDVDRGQLGKRVANLSFAEAVATVDAVERFLALDGAHSVTELGLCGDETMRN